MHDGRLIGFPLNCRESKCSYSLGISSASGRRGPPALRIAVAGWAVTSGRGMSNLIRFGLNRNLRSIFCSSNLDNDYDTRRKIDRVRALNGRESKCSYSLGISSASGRRGPPALRFAVAGWAVTSGRGMSNE